MRLKGCGAKQDFAPRSFGCGCGTPDIINGNPIIGSGGARVMQLGLKLNF